MGKKLEERKKENIDKIKIGACIELLLLIDNFETDFSKLEEYIMEYEEFFENQNQYILINQFQGIKEVLINDIDILLNDIDKKEIYCDYLKRYY